MRRIRILFSDILFVFIIVLLGLISILSYQRIIRFNSAYAWVNHSDQVKLKLVQAFSFLKDSEAGVRGYLLSGDSAFLTPYIGSEVKTNKTIISLDTLLRDNKEQELNLEALQQLVAAKFLKLGDILKNQGRPLAYLHTLLLEENSLMTQCREMVVKMVRIENTLLTERTQNKDRYATITPFYSLLFSIFAIIIVILVYFRLRNETSLRFKAEDSEAEILAAGEKLKESESKFRLLADSMPQKIWTSDANGNLDYFNDAIYRFSGLTDQGIKEAWTDMVHPEDREKNIEQWKHSLETGDEFHLEHRFRNSADEYRWQLSHAVPQKKDDGKIQMWIGSTTDIQDQKNFTRALEEKVKERTKSLIEANDQLENTILDLEQINSDLESFNYVASHDLQEPLRKIMAFCQQISDRDKNNLSDISKDYFNRITRASLRMQNLIDAFLAYSQTGTASVRYEHTDLNKILEDVKADLSELIDEKKAIIKSDKLPSLNVIPLQIRQLFVNLIGNALKYGKVDTVPLIRIDAQMAAGAELNEDDNDQVTNYWKISVEDNGIGFEQQYGRRIFELFERLHPKSGYSGTGIGLAICKKIIRNHKGFISAVGVPGNGAIFSIFIPANES